MLYMAESAPGGFVEGNDMWTIKFLQPLSNLRCDLGSHVDEVNQLPAKAIDLGVDDIRLSKPLMECLQCLLPNIRLGKNIEHHPLGTHPEDVFIGAQVMIDNG